MFNDLPPELRQQIIGKLSLQDQARMRAVSQLNAADVHEHHRSEVERLAREIKRLKEEVEKTTVGHYANLDLLQKVFVARDQKQEHQNALNHNW